MVDLNSSFFLWDDEEGILTYADWLEEIENAKECDKSDKPPNDEILSVIDASDLCTGSPNVADVQEDETRMFLVEL